MVNLYHGQFSGKFQVGGDPENFLGRDQKKNSIATSTRSRPELNDRVEFFGSQASTGRDLRVNGPQH
jgi:hypothetical protein